MTNRRKILLALTVIGFVVPNVMVAIFIADNGLDTGSYFGDWFGTLPSAQLGADLVIVSISFIAWSSWDGPRSGVGRWWLTIPATFAVGICFAVPLYLLMREDAVAPAVATA